MESIELFASLAKTYGPVTAVGMFNLWIYVINPKLKKMRGTYVGYKNINERNILQDTRLDKLEEFAVVMKEQVFKRDNRLDTLEIAHQRIDQDMSEMKYMVRDLSTNLKTNNRLMGEVKDALEAWKDNK